MKEIYTSNHIWTLFENFTLDMAQVRGEGWVGGTQQWWLGWGQRGVTEAPLKPSAGHGHTCGTSYRNSFGISLWGWGVVRALWCDHRSCVTSHVPQLSVVPAACGQTRGAISVLPVLTDVQEEGEAPARRHAGEICADSGAGHHQRLLQLALLRKQHLTAGDRGQAGWQGEDSGSASPPKHGLDGCTDAPVSPRPTRPSWCSSSSPPRGCWSVRGCSSSTRARWSPASARWPWLVSPPAGDRDRATPGCLCPAVSRTPRPSCGGGRTPQ